MPKSGWVYDLEDIVGLVMFSSSFKKRRKRKKNTWVVIEAVKSASAATARLTSASKESETVIRRAVSTARPVLRLVTTVFVAAKLAVSEDNDVL